MIKISTAEALRICNNVAELYADKDWHKLSVDEQKVVKGLEKAGYFAKNKTTNGFVGKLNEDLPELPLKVYDRVWIMDNNKPQQMLIFAVIEGMDYNKSGTDMHYRLVRDTMGAGWGNNEGIQRMRDQIFLSKAELLESL